MLFQIGHKARADDSSGEPAPLLLACHERIRTNVALSLRLGVAAGAPEPHVAEAAAAVRRYFGVALALHEADEELTLAPRLRAGGGAELADALDAMAAEHVRLHVILAALDPLWGRLVARPDELASTSAALLEGSRQLDALFRVHLEMEERVVFPATLALSAPDRAAIANEMRERRQAKP